MRTAVLIDFGGKIARRSWPTLKWGNTVGPRFVDLDGKLFSQAAKVYNGSEIYYIYCRCHPSAVPPDEVPERWQLCLMDSVEQTVVTPTVETS